MRTRTTLLLAFLALALAFADPHSAAARGNPIQGAPPIVQATPHVDSSAFASVKVVAEVVEQTMREDSIEASTTILTPFSREIRAAALKYHEPPALLAAFIQEESGFNPWAGRTEPGYLKKKLIIQEARAWSVNHHGIPTELTELSDRSRSFGPMQIMGQTAREQGYDSLYLASLYSPFNSIDQGAKRLKHFLTKYPGDTLSGISAYNQGNARKKHGRFENARYVYRVSTAWEAYDRLFNRTTHTKGLKGELHEATSANGTRDLGSVTSGTATDSALRRTDTGTRGYAYFAADSRSKGPRPPADGDRYDASPNPGSISAGEQPLSGQPDGSHWLATLFVLSPIFIVGVGYLAALYRSRQLNGHFERLVQSPDRFFPRQHEVQPSREYADPYGHAARHPVQAIRYSLRQRHSHKKLA